MKYFPLVWKNVWRRKFRTTFTLLSIFIAFLLFGILMTIRTAFSFGVEIAGLDRLVLINKVTLIMPLPLSYQAAAQRVPGVEVVTHQSWFNGIYQRSDQLLCRTSPSSRRRSSKIYPEFVVPPEQVKAGSAIGRARSSARIWRSDSGGRSATACR